MTTTPGYPVTITAFLPADPQSPREMAIAAAMLDNLDEHLEAMGLQERVVAPRFVQRHRVTSAPSAQAEPATQAPEPAAGADSPEYQAARTDAAASEGPQAGVAEVPSTDDARALTSPSTAPDVAGSGGHPCAHPPERRKRYSGGAEACTACGATLAGEAAA